MQPTGEARTHNRDFHVVIGIWFAIVVFIALPVITGRETIGSYPAVKRANGTLQPLGRTVYRINLATDTITCWTPGDDAAPYRLENCAIRSEKNWIAYYPWGEAVQMRKGRLVRKRPANPIPLP